MKVIIDTLGADKGSREIVEGTLAALEKREFEVVLAGNQEELEEILEDLQPDAAIRNSIEILEASEVIENDESPTRALRQKKNASIVKGMKYLKDGADGLLSFGSTGGALSAAVLLLGRLEGVKRPALLLEVPSPQGRSVLTDIGANSDLTPEVLDQLAALTTVYVEQVIGKEEPEVYLLNIGSEEGKGDKLRQETFDLMKEAGYKFKGNIEPGQFLLAGADIVITDGFTGNLVLKTMEATAQKIFMTLGPALKQTQDLEVLKSAKEMQGFFHPDTQGAVPIIGVKKPVFVGHGSSSKLAVEQGIYRLLDFVEKKTIEMMKSKLVEG